MVGWRPASGSCACAHERRSVEGARAGCVGAECPRRIHQTLSDVRPCSDVVAKGTPLSVRIARGRPYSRNSRSKIGRTPEPLVESSPWHASKIARVLIRDRERIAIDADRPSGTGP